jgi:hypothetical protein
LLKAPSEQAPRSTHIALPVLNPTEQVQAQPEQQVDAEDAASS